MKERFFKVGKNKERKYETVLKERKKGRKKEFV